MAAPSTDSFASRRKNCGFCFNPLWRILVLLLFAARSNAVSPDGRVSFNGQTDDMSYNIVKTPVHIHELHATSLRQLGISHEKPAFKYQGLDQRLTGVEPVPVVRDILT